MNWYCLYKFAYNINRDDVLTSRIVRDIFFIVKENMGINIFRQITVHKEDAATSKSILSINKNCELYLYTHNGSFENLRYEAFDIRAITNISKGGQLFDPFMRVDLYFSYQFLEKYFDKLYYVLYEAVKHEMDHYRQYINRSVFWDDDLESQQLPIDDPLSQFINLRDSLLSERELNPYVKGLVFTSKKQNISFGIILNKNMDGLFFGNNTITKEKVLRSSIGERVNKILLEVRDKVASRAKELYPYLRREK